MIWGIFVSLKLDSKILSFGNKKKKGFSFVFRPLNRIFATNNNYDMNIEQVREHTLSLPGVTEDQPFGDDNITFRLEGKIFMCLWLGGGNHDIQDSEPRFALKLTPERNEELRERFSAVTPAWHWNKKHWSDVYYQQLEDSLIQEWIRESYNLIASKLPKAVRGKYIL